MTQAIWLLAVLGALGAFDTVWFHEIRGKLVARPEMRPELRLHVLRDVLYVVVFATLPFLAWHGLWTIVLGAVLIGELVVTMADFVTEDRVRAGVGGVVPGERITHAVMGIVYGAMLAFLVPVLWGWLQEPTGLVRVGAPVAGWLRATLGAAAAGIALHGLRDLAAVLALPGSAAPWARAVARERSRPARSAAARVLR
jgi:hypothetical protein